MDERRNKQTIVWRNEGTNGQTKERTDDWTTGFIELELVHTIIRLTVKIRSIGMKYFKFFIKRNQIWSMTFKCSKLHRPSFCFSISLLSQIFYKLCVGRLFNISFKATDWFRILFFKTTENICCKDAKFVLGCWGLFMKFCENLNVVIFLVWSSY